MSASRKTTLKSVSPSGAREEALEILIRVDTGKVYVDRLLLERAKSQRSENFAFVQTLVKGTLKSRGRIDALLERFLKKGLDSLSPSVKNILRLGVYEVLNIERVPKEISVNEAVELAKRRTSKGASGMVNGVLRNIVRALPEILGEQQLSDRPKDIATFFSHPEWLVERWIRQFGLEKTKALCLADNRIWPVGFRINTLKCSRDELQKLLHEESVETEPSRFCPDCLLVKSLPKGVRIHELESFTRGLFIVQDESAALIGHVAAAQPGETIIDLCSAPGGKTTHLAALMRNCGKIVALDSNPRRLDQVRENCARLGVTIVETIEGDAGSVKFDLPADRVLLDAPCSGLGVLGRKSDLRWTKEEEDFGRLTAMQREMLEHAATLVKPGGLLVYSTCSIDPEEDEGIAEGFLTSHADFEAAAPPAGLAAALFTERGFLRTWPDVHGIAGAFAAAFRRTG